ncbi:MAG TPA: AI-2E family transporter [Stellaceae bacterium]|jgi:predicted PurR-regulated permease PerM|nr:AI-2E family transporter [Stellaceae bacterium]
MAPSSKSRFAAPAAMPTASKRQIWRPDMRRLAPEASVARALTNLALVALAVLFLWLTVKVDLVIFAGVLFGICLRRAADGLSRLTRLPAGWALLVVVLLIVGFFASGGWFFSQSIVEQINQLSVQLPAAAVKVGHMITGSHLGRTVLQHIDAGRLQTSPASMLQSVFGVAANLVEVVGGFVVVVFVALYVAAETGRYARGLLSLVAPARRPRAAEILHEAASAMCYWMLGRLFSMTVLGMMVALGLWLLGVPLPLALGFLAGIMIFVPYIGSIAAAIPTVVIAASLDLMLAVYVVALYIGVHLVEGYILVPLVQRRVVHLPPALTLSAQIILMVLAGFLGLLFATPLVAAALVMIRMIYVEDVLGDRGSAPAAPFE